MEASNNTSDSKPKETTFKDELEELNEELKIYSGQLADLPKNEKEMKDYKEFYINLNCIDENIEDSAELQIDNINKQTTELEKTFDRFKDMIEEIEKERNSANLLTKGEKFKRRNNN